MWKVILCMNCRIDFTNHRFSTHSNVIKLSCDSQAHTSTDPQGCNHGNSPTVRTSRLAQPSGATECLTTLHISKPTLSIVPRPTLHTITNQHLGTVNCHGNMPPLPHNYTICCSFHNCTESLGNCKITPFTAGCFTASGIGTSWRVFWIHSSKFILVSS